MLTYIIGVPFITAKVTESLWLIYASFNENMARRLSKGGLLNKIDLESFLLSTEPIEIMTVFTFILLPLGNFFVCDYLVGFILKSPVFTVVGLLLEIFIPMISYYIGEILSRKVREQHVERVLYRRWS